MLLIDGCQQAVNICAAKLLLALRLELGFFDAVFVLGLLLQVFILCNVGNKFDCKTSTLLVLVLLLDGFHL